MPFIAENFPVTHERSQTAIAGLSMGGREALFTGVSMPEAFVNNGADLVYYVTRRGHDFVVWKNGLYHFARNIFK
jgi:enterochelin esterase-like enzyme